MSQTLLVDRHVAYIQSLDQVRPVMRSFRAVLTHFRVETRGSGVLLHGALADERDLLGIDCARPHAANGRASPR